MTDMTFTLTPKHYLELIYDRYVELENDTTCLVFEGVVTQDITRDFTTMIENNLSRSGESAPTQRKVFNVMVESVQNISRHADNISGDVNEGRRGVVIISHSPSEYHIVTGNTVLSSKVEAIRQKLSAVNAADRAALSEMYKKQMQEGTITDKGGAGLGFIDIAKKSGNKIDFDFIDLSPEFSFFITIATVPR